MQAKINPFLIIGKSDRLGNGMTVDTAFNGNFLNQLIIF
jgi:hypothetical protein